MKMPITDYLAEILGYVEDDESGAVADYIPVLAKADPDQLGIAITTVTGRTYTSGDAETEFTIQSMSKPFAYATALTDLGSERVGKVVGIEPSGEAFNELSLEKDSKRPKNPMINAGALAVHQLLCGREGSWKARMERSVDFFSMLAGRKLSVNEEMLESEMETAHRNLALAHMLAAYDILQHPPLEVVRGYTAQCAIMVNTKDIAMMAAVLAGGGINPVTGEQVVPRWVVRRVLAVMATSGMYDEAGEWFTEVGIPAKSGVSGGILGALPGQIGMAAFSPRLNEHGNSVRGIKLFRKLSADMAFHLMDAEPFGSRSLRGVRDVDDATVVDLQGPINFMAAEIMLNRLVNEEIEKDKVVFDVSRVGIVNDVGRRMVLEGMRRLRLDGKQIFLRDPEEVFPDPDMGDGVYPTMVD